MKKLMMLTLLALPATVFAEAREEIKSLSTLNFDGNTLAFSYRVGGGFERHSADVGLELSDVTEKNGEYMANAKIKIFDVAPNADSGRALLSVGGKVDIQQLVTAKAKEAGINTGFITVRKIELMPVTYHPIQIP